MRKSVLFVGALAIASLSIAEAVFFGFNITNPAGGTIIGANANQTAGLAGLGLLSGILLLLGLRASQPTTTTVIRRPVRGRGRFRGKREAEHVLKNFVLDESDFELLDLVLKDVLTTSECYQRLVCDIGAGQEFEGPSGSMMTLLEMSKKVPALSNAAKKTLWKLNNSALLGESMRNVDMCEKVFRNCPYTGAQLDQLIASAKM